MYNVQTARSRDISESWSIQAGSNDHCSSFDVSRVIVFATCNRGSKKSSTHSKIHARPILNWETWLVQEGLSRARYPAVRFFAFHLSKVSDLTLAFKQWLPERLWEHEICSCLYFEFNFLQIINVNKCFIYNVI